MAQTILITGASSGIGQATAQYFAEQGWNVAATQRSPKEPNELAAYPRVKTYRLDVTEPLSIDTALASALADFGQIDVLLNNAGFSVFGAFECATQAEVQEQLNTNLVGVMNVTRAILPHFRQRRAGRLITITSIGGLAAFPLFTLYHASKWAVEGFMESLHYELEPFNIQVKIVEPGAVATHFVQNTSASKNTLPDYEAYVEKVKQSLLNVNPASYDPPGRVAQVIMRAATDRSNRMRYSVGNATLLVTLRRLLPLAWFHRMVKNANGL